MQCQKTKSVGRQSCSLRGEPGVRRHWERLEGEQNKPLYASKYAITKTNKTNKKINKQEENIHTDTHS